MFTLYIMTFPNNKKYVGITTQNINTRKNQHKHLSNKNNRALYTAIKSYGWENISWEYYTDYVSWEDLCSAEIAKIKELNTYFYEINSNGYNMTIGGDGNIGYKHSEQSKEKMSKSKLGIKLPEQQKQNISKSLKGKLTHTPLRGEDHPFYKKPLSEERKTKLIEGHKKWTPTKEFKEKISIAQKGKKLSIETKNKISQANKGNKHTEEQKINASKRSAVFSYEQVLEMRKLYSTGKYSNADIAKMFNSTRSTIQRITSGKSYIFVI